MRRFALAVAAASPILIWGVARAGNDAGANVAIVGTAPRICSFSTAPRQLSGSNMVLTLAALDPGQIEVSQLIDPNTGRLKSASIQVEFQGICNGLHAFSLKTSRGGLVALDDGTVTSLNYSRELFVDVLGKRRRPDLWRYWDRTFQRVAGG